MQRLIWLRDGDGSDYEQFGDDLAAVIDRLRCLTLGEFIGWIPGGLETTIYQRAGYISLYWGNSASDYLADLSAIEKAEVRAELFS